VGRFSFLGTGSSHLFRSKGAEFEILKNGKVLRKGNAGDPLLALEDFMGIYHPVLHDDLHDGLPRFSGGAVGYFSYDVVRSFEKLPNQLQQDIELYDSSLMVTDSLLAFDNLKKKIKVIINVFLDGRQSPKEAYQEAQKKIKSIIVGLQRYTPFSPARKPFPPSPLCSNFSKEDYMGSGGEGKGVYPGRDIIQVVPSQRFSKGDPLRAF